jgi:predicted RNase H-like HicB family nuclease/DNA-binding XRE family transcriptional regulator
MKKDILVGISKAGNCYNAHAPAFPGCLATGKTADEATSNLIEALSVHIKAMLADGEYIPDGDDFYAMVSVPVLERSDGAITGRHLREYRKKFGLTQAEMAVKLGVAKESVSERERERRESPDAVKFALAEVE